MLLLNNPYLNADAIIAELQQLMHKENKQGKSPLEILQNKLKTNYFTKDMTHRDVLRELNSPRFATFPRLKYVLTTIFNQQIHFPELEKYHDIPSAISFKSLNNQYGYFEHDLSALYHQLNDACRKTAILIERQAHDPAMAYKLIVLFYNPDLSEQDNFQHISVAFRNLIKMKQDKTIEKPYHDAFITALHAFPKCSQVKNIQGWKSFIRTKGFQTLKIFSECAIHREPFVTIQQAQQYLLEKKYPRALEHPALANICKKMLISEAGFNDGLKFIKSGWPKKRHDNLPNLQVTDKSGVYVWVKLPPQDMRALYLGNAIPGCCQHIDGHSSQCVKDGISLSDNGFYVLLKAKKNQTTAPCLIDEQINDKEFEIVGQSYAWISQNHNLCLDSIEWNPQRVSVSVIHELMLEFSQQVFQSAPCIRYIHVGKGGQTPQNLFPDAEFSESMKQGEAYGDATYQYQIASTLPSEILESLRQRLSHYPEPFQKTLLYLAPYFAIDEITQLPDALIQIDANIVATLPNRFIDIYFKAPLHLNDFTEIRALERSPMSTFRKIWNSDSPEDIIHWLPSIPESERLDVLKPWIKSHSFSLNTILPLLPANERLQALQILSNDGLNDCHRSISNETTVQQILDCLPQKDILPALLFPNRFGKNGVQQAIPYPKTLQVILQYLNKAEQILALKPTGEFPISSLSFAASYPASLAMILPLYTIQDRLNERHILRLALQYPESLQMLLLGLPTPSVLEAITQLHYNKSTLLGEAIKYPEALSILLSQPGIEASLSQKRLIEYLDLSRTHPEAFVMFLEIIPPEQRLECISKVELIENTPYLEIIFNHLPKAHQQALLQHSNFKGHHFLFHLCKHPQSLIHIVEQHPHIDLRPVLSEYDAFGNNVLHRVASNASALQLILKLYPEDQRERAVKHVNKAHISCLENALLDAASLQMVLDFYPPEKQQAIFKMHQHHFLYHAAPHPESLRILLNLVMENERYDIVRMQSPFNKCCLNNPDIHPNTLQMLLELYPPDKKYSAILESDLFNSNILTHALQRPALFHVLLNNLEPKDILRAIHETNKRTGQPYIHSILQDASLLQDLLAHLPMPELQLAAVKDMFIPSRLSKETLEMILNVIPQQLIIEILSGQSLLLAMYHPKLLKMRLDNIPASDRLHELSQRSPNQKTYLELARYQPESFQIILDTLPPLITMALLERKLDLKHHAHEVIFSLQSLQQFISKIQPVTDEKKLHPFVEALIQNEKIEEKLELLLENASHQSFFKMPQRETILQSIHELDDYWSSRILSTPSIGFRKK